MNKLVVCIMGQNCERFIEMCLESVKEADAIVYCDGGSTDNTFNIFQNCGIKDKMWIENKYNQEDLGMNGKQRNFYLNYLKQEFPDDWALILDADEVVENLSKIKEFIQTAQDGLYSVRMRHLIGDLAHEDSITDKHYVLNRLFKISDAGNYPEVEHPVLQAKIQMIPVGEEFKQVRIDRTECTTIWHLAYIPNMWEIKKRYDNHMKKSNMHSPQYLKDWYYAHLFGTYPRKQFNITDLPKIILDKFGIDKDEFYFANRGIDLKHPIMVKQWNDYFKPGSVLDLGCGRGCYLYFWKWFIPGEYRGIELSRWAVEHSFIDNIRQGDITDEKNFDTMWGLVTAIDVLEHLDNEQLDKALTNISKSGSKFLFSIPFIGDPNLENDNTHKQFRTKEDWIKLIESYGVKIKETPSNWAFASQILIGEKC